MKILFFLVTIANVTLFMWEYKKGTFAQLTKTLEQNATLNQEQIFLVSELKNRPQSIKPASVSVPSVTKNTNKIEERCYEVGPFANQNTYLTFVNQLKGSESEIKPIDRHEQIAKNYMVYYPGAETKSESRENIKMLKNHGIKDFWLLTGEDKGNISLGLFIKEKSALTMKDELLAKGIKAEVKARYKTKAKKYALIKSDIRLLKRLDELKSSYPNLSVNQILDKTQGCW